MQITRRLTPSLGALAEEAAREGDRAELEPARQSSRERRSPAIPAFNLGAGGQSTGGSRRRGAGRAGLSLDFRRLHASDTQGRAPGAAASLAGAGVEVDRALELAGVWLPRESQAGTSRDVTGGDVLRWLSGTEKAQVTFVTVASAVYAGSGIGTWLSSMASTKRA